MSDEPTVIPFPAPIPPEPDWTGLAIDRLDVNRLPERLRGPAAQLVRMAARRRGVAWPRIATNEQDKET